MLSNGEISLEQSLMFFTFSKEDRLILFSDQHNDKKTVHIASSPNVAIMLNSFEGQTATNTLLANQTPFAMTVYGKAKIVAKSDPNEKRFREFQQAANPLFAGAFQGAGTSVVIMTVDRVFMVATSGETCLIENPIAALLDNAEIQCSET